MPPTRRPFQVDDTPLRQAYQQEAEATSAVNQQASSQDVIAQHQREQQKVQADLQRQQVKAAQAQKINISTAKRQGIETEIDPSTAQERIKKHEDGAPVWQSGFLGGPKAGEDGSHIVGFRDPRGQRYDIPLDKINRTEDPTGNFYEFDLPGPDGQPQRIRRPEEPGKALFKIDPETGRRYAEAPDPTTGGFVQQPLGMDPVAANTAAIKQRTEKATQEKQARTFQADELRLQQSLIETEFKPVKEKFTELVSARKKFDTGTRYEQRQDGIYMLGSNDDFGVPVGDSPELLVKAKAWLTEKKRIEEELAKTQAEHDPIDAQIQAMQTQRDKLALQVLQDGHRTQLEIADLEARAKAGEPIWQTATQKRIADARRDKSVSQVMVEGSLEDEGSPLLADVQRATRNPIFDAVLFAMSGGRTQAPDVSGIESPVQVVLSEVLAETAASPSLTGKAQDINAAAASLGITDPDAYDITTETGEAYPVLRHRDTGEQIGYLDGLGNRLYLTPNSVRNTEQGRDIAKRAGPDTAPTFMMAGQAAMRPSERRDYFSAALQAVASGDEQAVTAAGADIPTIRKNVMDGRISIQDGRLLLSKLYNVTEKDYQPQTAEREFGDYLAKSPLESTIWKQGTPEEKAQVVNRFADGNAAQFQGNLFIDRESLAQNRKLLLSSIEGKGRIAGVTEGLERFFIPVAGIFGQIGAYPFQKVAEWSGNETEAGKLSEQQWQDWQRRVPSWLDKIQARPEVLAVGNEIEKWASTAEAGSLMPEDQAQRIADTAYDIYHQLNDDAAKALETTRDSFNPNKNPIIRGAVMRYMATADPAAMEQAKTLLFMDERDRQMTAKVSEYIERPRTATPQELQERAKNLDIPLTDGAAKVLMSFSKGLDAAKDKKQVEAVLSQAQKVLKTSTPEDTALAMSVITRQATDDPNSWWGLFKGGFIAGRQEMAIEAATTALEVGVSYLTAGAATPEILAAKAARQAGKAAMRGAMKGKLGRVTSASLATLSDQASTFARARRALGTTIKTAKDDFAALGIKTPKFGAPLTGGQKLSNAAVTLGKNVAVAAPAEAIEEGVAALGEANPSVDGLVQQMGLGALGGMVITPVFAGAARLTSIFKNRGAGVEMEKQKTQWVQTLNQRLAGEPGFQPLTVADFDSWQGIQDNPQHQAAVQEYQEAVSELSTAADPAAVLASQARVDNATQNLAGLSEVAFSAMDELRQIPDAERPLYVGAAKAISGATEYTEAEASALMRLSGELRIGFERVAQAIEAPSVSPVAPQRFRIPEGVTITIPDRLIADLSARAPSMAALIGNANSDALSQPVLTQNQGNNGVTLSPVNASQPGAVSPAQGAPLATPQDSGVTANAAATTAPGVVGPAQGAAEVTPTDAAPVPPLVEAPPAPTQNKPVEKLARRVIGDIISRSPKLKSLVKESKKAPDYATGGMWMRDDGTVAYHLPTITSQLSGLTPQQIGKRVEALLDEEIRHAAQMAGAKKLWEAEGKPWDFQTWRDAWYGDIWENQFTDEMRAKVIEAYGETLPEQPWIRAMEGLRMLDQLRATGSITEAVLRHLDAVLAFLRDTLKTITPTIRREMDIMRGILQEYGYEAGAVNPAKAKTQAAKPKKKAAKAKEVTPVSKPALTRPNLGDTIIDSGGSMGPVIGFDGETPIMGMEGENEGDVEPQAAKGGWELVDKKADAEPVNSEPSNAPAPVNTVVPEAPESDTQADNPRNDSSTTSEFSDAAKEQARKAFEGLLSAPAPALEQKGLPPDRLPAFIGLAQTLVTEKVSTPEKLAAFLDDTFPDGKARPFSQALWNALGMVDPSLTGQHDWNAVYAPKEKPTAKQQDEQAELQITIQAREIVQQGGAPQEIYAKLVELYRNQPKLSAKTSTSKINQAYSTPAPMAFVASRLGDVVGGKVIAEPSAGNGMLLIERQDGQTILANELDPSRRERLASQGIESTGADATTWTPAQAPDRVIANPPFGQVMGEGGSNIVFQTAAGDTTSIDHAILLKSLETMAPDGRAVFIIGGPPPTVRTDKGRAEYYRKGKNGRFMGHLYQNYGVVDHFTVSGDLYEKQGAGWPLDIIVVQGKQPSSNALPGIKSPRIVNSWEELANEIDRTDTERHDLARLTEAEMRGRADEVADGLRGLGAPLPTKQRDSGDAGNTSPTGLRGKRDAGTEDGGVPRTGGSVGTDVGSDIGATPISPATEGVRSGTSAELASPDAARDPSGSDANGVGQSRPREVTEFQASFPPSSGVNPAGLLAPVNLIDPMTQALNRLKEKVGGDLVRYVHGKLGYPAKTDISKYFFGDQIDALAQAIHTAENGGALVIGDQTGTGKGRIAAGLMKYAVKRGIVAVFATKNPDLYDAMLDDLADIDAPEVVPLVTNEKIEEKSLRDKLKSVGAYYGQKAFDKIDVTGKLPAGVNVVFTTYDQIKADDAKGLTKKDRSRAKKNQEAPPSSWRMAALRRIAPNAIFILDESHLAGGQSATGWRFGEVLKLAKHAYYSSATFAKRPDNMGIYFRTNLGQVGGDIQGLMGLMQAGGVPAMQVGSSMLAQDGQYMRRERSFEGVSFDTQVTQETYERDKMLADNYTEGLRTIISVQERMASAAEVVNKILGAYGKSVGIPSGNRARLESSNFSAKLHSLVRQYLLAIKANSAAQVAVKAIKEGHKGADGTVKSHKVIVAVENTMESVIEDLVSSGLPLDFNGVLQLYLNQMRKFKVSGGSYGKEPVYFEVSEVPDPAYEKLNDKELQDRMVKVGVDKEGQQTVDVDSDASMELVRRIMTSVFRDAGRVLEGIDLADMPVSPIDAMRQAVERAGIRTGEMTGRSLGIDSNGETYSRSASEVKGKLQAKDAFNNEDLDFLVINKSGSTGVSMHASEKFKDQRPRMMIVVQPNLDINEFMQTIGRIHRAGQVELPAYVNLQTALPAENRPAAILGRKMAMLNANTTSNADSELSQKETVDLFNQYGDEVVHSYLMRNPGLVRLLAQSWDKLVSDGKLNPLGDFQSAEGGGEYGYLSRSVTGHLAILPVDEQEVFWETVTADYRGLIDYLDQIGKNDLRASVLDMKAETVSKEIFTEGAGGESESVFSDPSYLETVNAKMGKEPLSTDESQKVAVAARAKAEERQVSFMDSADAWITKEEASKAAKARHWEERREEWIKGQEEQRDTIANAIGQIGSFGTYTRDDGTMGSAFVEDVIQNPDRPNTPSAQIAIVRVNDSQDRLKLPVSKFADFFNPSSMTGSRREQSERDAWQRTWTFGSQQAIVTGNLLSALQQLNAQDAKGRIINYTKADGAAQMGILLPQNYAERMQARQKNAIPVQSFAELQSALDEGRKIKSREGSVTLSQAKDGSMVVEVPASRAAGGKYWRDPALNRLMRGGEFEQRSNHMVATAGNAEAVFDYLRNAQKETFVYSIGQNDSLASAPADPRSSMDVESAPVPTHTFPDGYTLTRAGLHTLASAPAPIRAYHGTPHKVDRFSLDKIGTGEGNQAYGWGLYFAESAEVALQYSNIRATPTMDFYAGNRKLSGLEASIADDLTANGKAVALINAKANGPEWLAAFNRIKDEKVTRGRVYTVELLPDEADFLDWDKPLSEQSERTRERVVRAYIERGMPLDDVGYPKALSPNLSGEKIYAFIGGIKGEEFGSQFLQKFGIPGIRYLDGNSRDGGSGTSNYVIFDEKIVRILEENGQPVLQGLASAPAPDPENQARLKAALEAMQPIWRDVLEASMKGKAIADIAKDKNLSETAVGNILRVAQGRLKVLMEASKDGKVRPTVQVEDAKVKATSGAPSRAMGADPAFVAVDQRRARPEEVTHAEMQDMAGRLFAADPVAAEKLIVRWMDSGTTVLSTDGMPEAIKALITDAQARSAAEMLMTAAAKLLVTKKSLEGGNDIQTARLIDLYRNTGTEQARALNMRFDPHQKPEERAAMFIAEALLTPPDSMRNQMRRNPANKDNILAEWSVKAQEVKAQLKGMGYDIDATFAALRREQAAAERAIPVEVKVPLSRVDGKTRKLVQAILEGKTWREAADGARMTPEEAKKAYNDFRQTVNDAGAKAAQAARDVLLASAPANDFAAQIGLPEWTDDVILDSPPVKTEATEELKKERTRKKEAGEIDLSNPVDTARAINAMMPFKSATFDKISEFWRASILSGPQTQVVNLFSGLAFGGYEATVKKIGAGAAADIARMFGMQTDAASLSDIPAMLSATIPAVKRAFGDALRAWKAEASFFNAYALDAGRPGESMVKADMYQPALGGPVGKIMRGISFRLMLLADEFVKSFFTRIEVAAQARQIARAEGLKGQEMADRMVELLNPGSEAWVRALDQALKITFQTELGTQDRAIDQIDGLAMAIQKAKKGDFGALLKGLSHFIFPFVATPTNIFKMGISMSPLGTVLALIDGARSLNERRKGNAEEAQRLYNAARLFDDVVNQTVAWGMVFIVSELVQPGDDEDALPFVTGSLPWKATSEGERAVAYRTAPPTSIRIGDRWYSYGRLDPFASSLAFIVDSVKEFQKDAPMDEVWAKIGIQMLTTMQDKTFLQGFSDVMNAIQNPERFGTRWASNIATGFIPNLIRQPIRSADDNIRENDLPNDMGFWEGLATRVGYSIVPQTAPPAIDVWGREEVKGTGTGGPLTDTLLRLFSPVQSRDVSGVDPLDVALLRYNMVAEKPFGVTAPDRELSKTLNGVTMKASLTDEEWLDLMRKSGNAARLGIGNRFNGRDLTDDDVKQIKGALERAQSMYRDLAKRKAFSKPQN